MSYKIDAGPVRLRLNPATTIIVLDPAAIPAAEGYDDVHITLPWNGRFFVPHATFRGGGKKEMRVDFAKVPLDEFLEAMQALRLDFAIAWLEYQTRVTGEELADNGWTLVGLDDSVFERLAHHFEITRKSLRLLSTPTAALHAAVEVFFDERYELDPRALELEPERVRALQCVIAVRLDPIRGMESAFISYSTFERVNGDPGWYALPLDGDRGKMVVEVMLEKCRTTVVAAVRQAEAALGFAPHTYSSDG